MINWHDPQDEAKKLPEAFDTLLDLVKVLFPHHFYRRGRRDGIRSEA
jgi:hypothetical protein